MAKPALADRREHWKGGGQACSAINCTNSRKKVAGLSFFKFPKDPERCRKWVANVRREDLYQKTCQQLYTSYSLCANHFEDSQFMNPMRKISLIHSAVPTLFDIPDLPEYEVAPSRPIPKESPSPPHSSKNVSAPKPKQSGATIQTLKKKVGTLQKELKWKDEKIKRLQLVQKLKKYKKKKNLSM